MRQRSDQKHKQCRLCHTRLPLGTTGSTCQKCTENPPMVATECSDCGKSYERELTASQVAKSTKSKGRCPECSTKLMERSTGPDEAVGQVLTNIDREYASRTLARKYLIPYIIRFDPKYKVGWVHNDIAKRLAKFVRDVEEGKSPRLMLSMPPRHGKSRLVSVEFLSWALGLHPEWEFIATSYAVSLPIEFSRDIRGRLREPAYQVTFPKAILHPDSQSVESWRTTEGGGYLAAGVGGPITGRGAHILLVDDPIKNAEDADSMNIRNSVWNWFTTTAYTRLAPGGGLLIIQTRWHADDLSGRLEAQAASGEGEPWEVVKYPAIAIEDEEHRKQGEALHAERYDINELRRIQKAVGTRAWNALYQQNPVPDTGAYFETGSFRYYDRPPALLDVYNTWDLAVGKQQHNDWSVGMRWGVDPEGDVYVLDLLRARMNSYEIADAILDMWVLDKRTKSVGIEEGVIKHAIGPYLEQRAAERRAFAFHTEPLKPGRSDKVARARTAQGMVNQGRVFFPKGAKWLEAFEQELVQFPYGAHDDQVDVLAYACRSATEVSPPRIDTSSAIKATTHWMQTLLRKTAITTRSKDWRTA